MSEAAKAEALRQNGREYDLEAARADPALTWLEGYFDIPAIVAAAVTAERARCAEVVNAARNGEMDTDLRSIRSMIESGYTRDQIKAL